jgi:hypothetical protein
LLALGSKQFDAQKITAVRHFSPELPIEWKCLFLGQIPCSKD